MEQLARDGGIVDRSLDRANRGRKINVGRRSLDDLDLRGAVVAAPGVVDAVHVRGVEVIVVDDENVAKAETQTLLEDRGSRAAAADDRDAKMSENTLRLISEGANLTA